MMNASNHSKKKFQVNWVVYLLVGISAVSAQVFFLRELLVVFQGNEFSIGFSLASWLIWTALGSYLAGRLLRCWENPKLLGFYFLGAGLLLPLTMLTIRLSRGLFFPTPGEMIGPWGILIISFATLSLFCLFAGGLFTVCSQMEIKRQEVSPASGTSVVYLFESFGSGLGGIIVSLILVPYLQAVLSVFLLGCLLIALSLIFTFPQTRYRQTLLWIPLIVGGSLLFAPRIEQISQRYQWEGLTLVETTDSKYSRISLTRQGESWNVYLNGLISFTIPDPQTAEELVHFALLEHPSPRRVLLLGGGLGGGLAEALKHPTLEKIDYLELDPRLLQTVRKHIPAVSQILDHDKVKVHSMDSRNYLKQTQDRYDVVILSAPEPMTVQLNRFFTLEFFKAVQEVLRPEGLFSFSIEGSENYMSDEFADYVQTLERTLQAVFSSCLVLPGPVIHFIASSQTAELTPDSNRLINRLRSRNIDNRFVNENFIPFRFSIDRIESLQQILNDSTGKSLNRDFHPVAYLARSKIWLSQFQDSGSSVLADLRKTSFENLLGIGFLTIGLLVLLIRIVGSSNRILYLKSTALLAILSTGLIGISLELILLIGFQVIYGYVYYQMVVLIGFFMFGLGIGGGFALMIRDQFDLKCLLVISTSLSVILPFFFVLTLQALAADYSSSHFLVWTFFPFCALLGGSLGGFQFPLISQFYYQTPKHQNIGMIYAVDVIGACIGSIMLSGWLMPWFGIRNAAILVGMVGLLPLFLILSRKTGIFPER